MGISYAAEETKRNNANNEYLKSTMMQRNLYYALIYAMICYTVVQIFEIVNCGCSR